MKSLLIILLCLAALLTAGTAQAYAIYNHVGHEVCVGTKWTPWTFKKCKYTIPPHSTHNGGHGDSLSNVYVYWKVGNGNCKGNYTSFSIPHGGYARIYDDVVKIYEHDGKHYDHKKTVKDNCGGF